MLVCSRARPPCDEIVIVRGDGPYIYDSDGKRYLDGLSGSFTSQLGHGRRDLAAVMERQAAELEFFPLWCYAHPRAIELAERVAGYAPGDLNRVFFTPAAAKPWNLRGSSPSSTSNCSRRGAGYFYGIELVKDKDRKETFTDEESNRLLRGFPSLALFEAGLYCRSDDRGDPVLQLAAAHLRADALRRDQPSPPRGPPAGLVEDLSAVITNHGNRENG